MKIKFSCDAHLLGAIPNPVSAIKAAPDYFKLVKPQVDNNPQNGTVKRCVPFLDALSAGFIIPMWCDVYVLARNGEMSIDFPPHFAQRETLGSHSSAQLPKHPLANKPYGNMPMKWINPWVIETEPGVSCIFTPPLNHMETRFKLLDGVVDTDTYYNNINFPFLWTGGDGEFFIAKGTPLVQVIPFRREEQQLEVSAVDDAKRRTVNSTLSTKLKNGYRDELWHGKKQKLDDGEINFQPSKSAIDGVDLTNQEVKVAASVTPQLDELSKSELLHMNGYVVLRNIITHADADRLTEKLREFIDETNAQADDVCLNSKAVRDVHAFDKLLEVLTPAISEASGKRLIPTYSYARMYVNGAVLPKHFDRPACQYSVSLCLGMDGEPWPIFMAKKSTPESGSVYVLGGIEHYMGDPSSVNLSAGDGVLYLGMDMVHYREPFEGQWQAQVFLHWVDADGPHADQKYDGRLSLSHHQTQSLIDDNVIPLNASVASTQSILEVDAAYEGRGFGEGDF